MTRSREPPLFQRFPQIPRNGQDCQGEQVQRHRCYICPKPSSRVCSTHCRVVNSPSVFRCGHVHGHDEVRSYCKRQWAIIDPHVEPVEISPNSEGELGCQSSSGCALTPREISFVGMNRQKAQTISACTLSSASLHFYYFRRNCGRV
jgi:hypothetical protein